MTQKEKPTQGNVLQFSQDEIAPSEHKRECILTLITERRCARRAIREIDEVAATNRADARLAKKHRASGNPLLIRNAEVLEARIAERKSTIDFWNEVLFHIGVGIKVFADDVDRLISTHELLDILEVNPVDRKKVRATDGIFEIVFAHGLEDSATHRGSDMKEGPLFRALLGFTMRTIKTNPELQRQVTDGLFGKGGMFEFVPTYSRNAAGEFVRNPPKLRLADNTDSRATPISP